MRGHLARRIGSALLAILFAVTTTAQQAVGIVSTVANLVSIVEGQAAVPIQVNQPVVEGAAYRVTGHSAAEFTFPEGLRAAAGPSSSVAFHPSPAGGGTRLVSVSEGLFRFQLPNAGDRVDVQTPYGAFRAVSGAPGSELVVKVGTDGTVQLAATSGRVEIRDMSSGALLVLLENGQSATLASASGAAVPGAAAAAAGLAVVATGPMDAALGAQVADLGGLLSGQFAAASAAPAGAGAGAAAGDPAAAEASNGGAMLGWGLAGAAMVGGIVAAAVSGGGGGHHGGTTTTTTTTGN